MILELAILLLFPAMMALAGAMDLFTMTIPNRIPLLLVAGFVCIAPFAGFDWTDIGYHLAIGTAALLCGLFCFARGWIGGGDAKLFAATALWIGHEDIQANGEAMITDGAATPGAVDAFIDFHSTIPSNV